MPSSGGKPVPWTARDTEQQRRRRQRYAGESAALHILPALLRRLRRDPRILALYKELEIRDLIQSETSRMQIWAGKAHQLYDALNESPA